MNSVSSAQLGEADVRLLREPVVPRGDEHDLVVEHLSGDEPAIATLRAHDGQVDLAGEQHLDRPAASPRRRFAPRRAETCGGIASAAAGASDSRCSTRW